MAQDLDLVERAAVAALERFLHWALDLPEHGTVNIYTWRDQKGGLRVGEVSTCVVTGPTTCGGASWAEGDSEALGIICAVERALLEFQVGHEHPKTDQDPPDLYCEALARVLCTCLTGEAMEKKLSAFWAPPRVSQR